MTKPPFFSRCYAATLTTSRQRAHGWKNKQRTVTVLLCCNANGSKRMSYIIIGQYKRQRCFKNKLSSLYIQHTAKVRMTATILATYSDNGKPPFMWRIWRYYWFCTTALHIQHSFELTNFEFTSLPANTESKVQILDGRIIWSMKGHYRRVMVPYIPFRLENVAKTKLAAVDLLKALHYIPPAWNAVFKETIAARFMKAGVKKTSILEPLAEDSATDQDNYLLQQTIQELGAANPISFQEVFERNEGATTSWKLTEQQINTKRWQLLKIKNGGMRKRNLSLPLLGMHVYYIGHCQEGNKCCRCWWATLCPNVKHVEHFYQIQGTPKADGYNKLF